MDGNRGGEQILAGRGYPARQVALVLARDRQARHDFVTFGNLVLDGVGPRCGFPEDAEGFLEPFAPIAESRERRRVVIDVVGRDEIIHRRQIATIDLGEEPTNQCLVVFLAGHSYLPCSGGPVTTQPSMYTTA